MLVLCLLLVKPASAVDYVDGDYGGEDLLLADGDTLGGVLTNVGTVTVPADATVTTSTPVVELHAAAVVVDGVLSADGAGDTGGAAGIAGPSAGGAGAGDGGGGGGGPGPCMHGGGGGGGGYGGAGGSGGHLDGAADGWGLGGEAHGSDDLVAQPPGSGGGGGGSACDWDGRRGGPGGGSLYIVAESVTVTGVISADGIRGGTIVDPDDDGGAGGGGSGGAVVIDTPALGGGGLIRADGAVGGSAGGPWAGAGGGGSGGRIIVTGDFGDLDYQALGGAPGVANYDPSDWPLADRGALGSIVVGFGGPPLTFSVDGACPGPVGIEGTGFAPGASYAILQALGVGDAPVPGGPCAGEITGLADVGFGLLIRGTADADGRVDLSPTLRGPVCNAKLQLVDLATCRMSAVRRF